MSDGGRSRDSRPDLQAVGNHVFNNSNHYYNNDGMKDLFPDTASESGQTEAERAVRGSVEPNVQPLTHQNLREANSQHFGRARGSAYSVMSDPSRPHEEGVGFVVNHVCEAHVRYMEGYDNGGMQKLGDGIKATPPNVNQIASNGGGWTRYEHANIVGMIPARTMCINIPLELFSNDASCFKDWQTPTQNSIRAASIAALVGLLYTPLSKGMVSGAHEENARMKDAEDAQSHDDKDKKPAKPVESVKWYQMQNQSDKSQNVPMLLIGVEDVYNSDKTVVLALRLWHFIFDHSHSSSELANKLMNESHEEFVHSGSAHCQNAKRRISVVSAAKATQTLLGTSLESTKLEEAAGMCYRHVTNLSDLKKLFSQYGGMNAKDKGRQPVDLEFDKSNPNKVPKNLLNKPLVADSHLGCTHPLGLEWVLNAKREEALQAGLVHMDGTAMDVHPDQMNVTSYFDLEIADEQQTNAFRLPSWVGYSDCGNGSKGKGCFSIQSDPYKLNVFDMTFPHPVAGLVRPGKNLLRLFRERCCTEDPKPDIDSPKLANMLQNYVTERDAYIEEQIASWTNSVVSFDTFNCSPEQRHEANVKRSAALQGVTSYGQRDGDHLIVEPRRVLKEHAYASNQLYDKLLAPYFEEQEFTIEEQETKIRNQHSGQDLPMSHPSLMDVVEANKKFHLKKRVLMKELVTWHLAKMQRSFTSKVDQEAIPVGYKAVWQGLEKELNKMKAYNEVGVATANVGQAFDINLVSSDRSVFGQLENWLWTFMEEDCYIDGRGWSTMQELFYHCFEQFGPTTLLLIICGSKGTGKTLRTERLMKALVDGWMTMAGPSSAKAGMHGDGGSTDGTNCFYDEMIDELTDGDGSNRTEYWKMILLKRQYVYLKTAVMKGSDGVERHKTFKLITPHQETHIVCTNRGPAFTKGQEEPSEVKAALIDRSNFKVVSAQGSKTHDDAEFESNMRRPEVQRKVCAFRILTCLAALLKMLIYRQSYLQPDLSFAQKLFDEWDKEIDEKYGLPKLSPRKNIKRIENLITMCCLNAVAHVFFYKGTSCTTEAGRVDAEFPNGRPFKIEMLYECVQILQPTREMIHRAWTMGLEYSIGTSSMGTTTMTAVAENIGMEIGSFFKVPAEDYASHTIQKTELLESITKDSIRIEKIAAKNGGGGGGEAVIPTDPSMSELYEFDSYFKNNQSVIKEEDLKRSREWDRKRREARVAYQLRCSKNSGLSRKMKIKTLVENSILEAPATLVSNMSKEDIEKSKQRGRGLYEKGQEPEDLKKEPPEVLDGYHELRSHDFKGKKNCLFECCRLEQQKTCYYCSWDIPDSFRYETANKHMTLKASLLWPTLLDGSLFYKPQTLVQMASDGIAEVDVGCGQLATRRFLSGFSYKKKKIGNTGASRVDIGWVQATADQFTSWGKAADYMVKSGNLTVGRFDVHAECLRDTMYLLSCKENARRCPEEPRLEHKNCPEMAMQDTDQKRPATDIHRFVCVRPYDIDGDNSKVAYKTHQASKRHKDSGISQGSFQRRFDSLLQGGRLCALNVLVSNRITTVAPIRMHHEGIEVNVGGMYNHVSLVAEMVKALASVPGLKNLQEVFSNSKQGPMGLAADRTKLSGGKNQVVSAIIPSPFDDTEEETANSADAHSEEQMDVDNLQTPHEENGEFSNVVETPGKRGRDTPPEKINMNSHLHKLPYSIDVVPMGLALDMAGMLYDDKGKNMIEGYRKDYDKYGFNLKYEDLPQLSTQFVGYAPSNRQTISLKLHHSKREGQEKVDACDPDMSQINVSRTHVSCSIGREATDLDIENWVARRQGARSTGQIEGDLFAYSTWLSHTLTTMCKRGFAADQQDPSFQTCRDMEHMMSLRLLELACEKNDIDMGKQFNVDFDYVKLKQAKPSTYSAVDKESGTRLNITRKKPKANRPNLCFNGGYKDALRVTPKEENLWDDDMEVESSIDLGKGPE